jgi:hypothetical protein
MKGVIAFVTYSHRKGTTQQSAAIMASLTGVYEYPGTIKNIGFPSRVELQMRTITAMITNTNCQ